MPTPDVSVSRSGKAAVLAGAIVTVAVGVTHWNADPGVIAGITTIATFVVGLVVRD